MILLFSHFLIPHLHCSPVLWLYFYDFLKNIYLFIFGCTGSTLLHAGFLWWWRAGAPLSCGGQALEHTGSAAAVHGLSCPMACVGSSLTRDGTHAPCIGRCILSPGPPGKPFPNFLNTSSFPFTPSLTADHNTDFKCILK